MEWDPNERDAWVSDAQRWIRQIKGVLQCKIDLDAEGEISGVHVVAGMERDARHIVRDVESLLKARLEIDVFYKKIGVVQVLDNGLADADADDPLEKIGELESSVEFEIPDPEPQPQTQAKASSAVTFHPDDDPVYLDDEVSPPLVKPIDPVAADPVAEPLADDPMVDDPNAEAPPIPAVLLAEELPNRVVCSGVGVMASDLLVRAEVQLKVGDLELRGTAEGSNHAGSAIQLVAQATLSTLNRLVLDPILLHLKEVRVDQVAGQSVILCAVELVEGRKSETLFGSCSNLHNEQQAVVFSILDAMNRRLSMYSLKTNEAEG